MPRANTMRASRNLLIALFCLVSGAYVTLCLIDAENLQKHPHPRPGESSPSTPAHPGTPMRNMVPSGDNLAPTMRQAKPTVILDRGPRRPDESAMFYEQRRELAREFDSFVAASGLSRARQQRVLLTLYDLQETMFALLQDVTEAARERGRNEPHPFDDGADEVLNDAVEHWAQQLNILLDSHERQQWRIHCGGCWMRLYGMRILRLEDAPAGSGPSGAADWDSHQMSPYPRASPGLPRVP